MQTEIQTKTYIYFPQGQTPNRAPRVIHVSDAWGDSLKGSENAEEVQAGKFQFFPARRCQIFSQSLWDACKRWVTERERLEAEFDKLMRKGVDDARGAEADLQVPDL